LVRVPPPFSAQAIATLLILIVCGALVIYPVVFLVEAALNTGDPQEFPLQEWGLGNFAVLQAAATHPPRGDEDRVAIRTAYIDLAARPVNGAPNAAAGNIRQRLFHGDFIQYIVDWPAGQLTVRRPPTEMFEEGAAVAISFAAEHCVLLET
jgi:hypothetical protein